jgi:hypothetical protein
MKNNLNYLAMSTLIRTTIYRRVILNVSLITAGIYLWNCWSLVRHST